MNSEIFPSNYTVYCCDGDTSGGGVFIAVIDEILSTRQQHLETSCEMAWAKISVVACKDLYVCSYYRPKADGKDILDLLFSSLDRTCNSKNCHIWLAGDVNFHGISWPSKTLNNCPSSDLHELFVKCLDVYSLTQMVDKPTRFSNTLDLFITNNPTLISGMKVIPSLADHDPVTIEGDNKQKPRKFTYRRKQIGMVSKNLCKAAVMTFVTAHFFPSRKMMKMILNHSGKPSKANCDLESRNLIHLKLLKRKLCIHG